MAAVSLTPEDLIPFNPGIPEAKALAMIEDALALAARVAPCITASDFQHAGAAKALLRSAILRWNDAGTGSLQSESLEDYQYTQDTRQQRRGLFWPSEITQLQELCRTSGPAGAFSVDTVNVGPLIQHADICAVNFGALYCSCGAVLTQAGPLWETRGAV